ncbi:MAG: efflux RND transporter periplasmic adaptor subunit [Flavobacteriaceae bacterium]|jgi:Cu(I)/Ag(I) efflux system membrane fusion protein|nr:efflux RND transporter periplasmic adaptor subunit [Flavobacteriaceae bacterium]
MKIFSNQYMRYILFALIGLFFGWLFFYPSSNSESDKSNSSAEIKAEIWTCSMHPQIRMDKPGKCPICGMDLILLNQNSTEAMDPDEIHFTKEAIQLAKVMTSVVSKQQPIKEIRLNGKVQADERLLQSQVAYIPGRIERLYLNFTGEPVRKGQLLALIYSPDLITAQQELLETVKTKNEYPAIYEAAKEKLLQWKLSPKQIANIESTKKVKTNIEVYATSSGIVTSKQINVGDYVGQGTVLFEVTDLSRVWVLFDAYESDLHFLKKGNKIDFTIQAIPNSAFNGIISFIDPVIDPINRVAKVRVEINNQDGKLKPEMFVTGFVKANLDQYQNKMVIPKTAVLWTGKRSIVYVKKPGDDPIFKIREIELGPMLGNSYVVEKGLKEGEEIVTQGAFSVDAAAQLEGKPSMMNSDAGATSTDYQQGDETPLVKSIQKITISEKAKKALEPIINEYVLLQEALSKDDFSTSKKQVQHIKTALSKVNMSMFKGDAHNVWMQFEEQLSKSIKVMESVKDIENIRKSFLNLSVNYVSLVETFGPFSKKIYVINCPMANNNKGGDWLTYTKEVKNPYYGKSMLTCGSIKKEY